MDEMMLRVTVTPLFRHMRDRFAYHVICRFMGHYPTLTTVMYYSVPVPQVGEPIELSPSCLVRDRCVICRYCHEHVGD